MFFSLLQPNLATCSQAVSQRIFQILKLYHLATIQTAVFEFWRIAIMRVFPGGRYANDHRVSSMAQLGICSQMRIPPLA
ncbi:MAG: hypothetical protein KME08_18905 [Aphanothece sp. CMT-3BRIN-NPC111]|jgi:hypothetical protein|nr:hypothetical protein [Aphanothece sp. CMT-3BRIN-NPC111]